MAGYSHITDKELCGHARFDEQLAPLRATRPILSLCLQRRGNLAKVSVFQEQELSGFLRKDWNLEDISHSKKQSSGLLCQCYLSVFPQQLI